jgi:hypothetical protein
MIIPSNTLTFLQHYTSLEDNAKCHEFLGPGLQEIPNKHIYDYSVSWLGTSTSIKSDGVNLVDE